MTAPGPWATTLLTHRLVQPDRLSCGAASLVVATAWRDDAYAELLVTGTHPATGWAVPGSVAERFDAETRGMHRRVTGPADRSGRPQLPWQRHLGTPPWAIARQLSTRAARYVVRQAVSGRGRTFADVERHVGAGSPVAVYVGTRWAPRHVVLALTLAPEGVGCYDPATGRLRTLARGDVVGGRLDLGRWTRPWFVVLPTG